MKPVRRTDRRGYIYGARTARIIAALAIALLLSFAPSSLVAAENKREPTFEDRAAAEKTSRSSYRKLEFASLVVIFITGVGAVYWVMRRRKS